MESVYKSALLLSANWYIIYSAVISVFVILDVVIVEIIVKVPTLLRLVKFH